MWSSKVINPTLYPLLVDQIQQISVFFDFLELVVSIQLYLPPLFTFKANDIIPCLPFQETLFELQNLRKCGILPKGLHPC